QVLEARQEIARVLGEVITNFGDIRARLDQLDDIQLIFSPVRHKLHVEKRFDRDHRQACALEWVIEDVLEMTPQGDRGKVVNRDTRHLNGDTGLERNHDPVVLEGFLPDKKVDVYRGSEISVRADGKTTGEGIADLQLLEHRSGLERGFPELG